MKKFKDIKIGDSIYLVKNLKVLECKVKRKYKFGSYSFEFHVHFCYEDKEYLVGLFGSMGRSRSGNAFTTREEADSYLKESINSKHALLEEQIDQIMKELDRLTEFLNNIGKVEEKDIILFKDVKVGDKIFRIDKKNLSVKNTVVEEIENTRHGTILEIKSPEREFTTYPGSTMSLSKEFYTSQGKALLGLIKFAERKTKFLEEKMDGLIIRFEKEEKLIEQLYE